MRQIVLLLLCVLMCVSVPVQSGPGKPPLSAMTDQELRETLLKVREAEEAASKKSSQFLKDWLGYRTKGGTTTPRDRVKDPLYDRDVNAQFHARSTKAMRESEALLIEKIELEKEAVRRAKDAAAKAARPPGKSGLDLGRKPPKLEGPLTKGPKTVPGLRNTVPIRDTIDMRAPGKLGAGAGVAADEFWAIPWPKPKC